jgi:hypothetical protein
MVETGRFELLCSAFHPTDEDLSVGAPAHASLTPRVEIGVIRCGE